MARLLKHLRDLLIIFVITFILCEITIRLFGHTEYRIQPFSIESDPELYLLPHWKLGFTLNPGRYQVTVNKGLKYSVTHHNDSSRITSLKNYFSDTLNLPVIDIHGCSFAYGWGVDDSLSYPFQLQNALPESRVRNLAVPGYGTLQTLLILKDQLASGRQPDVLVMNYAWFHDRRDALTPYYRQSLKNGFEVSNKDVYPLFRNQRFPFASLSQDNTLKIQSEKWGAIHNDWPLRRVSALVAYLQYLSTEKAEKNLNERRITELILDEIISLCQLHKITLIVTGITSGEATDSMLSYVKKSGANTLKMGIDLNDPQYNNSPFDGHPNAKAHAVFAKKVKALIETKEPDG